jgi:hypothetical protein
METRRVRGDRLRPSSTSPLTHDMPRVDPSRSIWTARRPQRKERTNPRCPVSIRLTHTPRFVLLLDCSHPVGPARPGRQGGMVVARGLFPHADRPLDPRRESVSQIRTLRPDRDIPGCLRPCTVGMREASDTAWTTYLRVSWDRARYERASPSVPDIPVVPSPGSDQTPAPLQTGDRSNPYAIPLDVGDEFFAFEEYRSGPDDRDVWYRG